MKNIKFTTYIILIFLIRCSLVVPDISGYIAALLSLLPKGRQTIQEYRITPTIIGLSGTGLVLQNNGGDDLSVFTSGKISFATKLKANVSYAVTILKQPSNPTQVCTVSDGTGTVVSGDVTSVIINCTTSYTLGGSVTGLTGFGLVIQDTVGGQTLSVTANGSFAFATVYSSGTVYTITVQTQPVSQHCIVSSGATGTIAANVTSITINCYASAALDTSFAGVGFTDLNDIGGGANLGDMGQALTFDSTDKIYVGINTADSGAMSVAAVCRFNVDGTLDTSYASASSFPGCGLTANNYFVQGITLESSTGRIYMSGNTNANIQFVARFNANGTIDTSFGTLGYQTFLTIQAYGIILDSSGRPIVTGRTNCGATCDWSITRLTTTGALDTSFNGTGSYILAGGYATGIGIGIDTNGKIVTAGFGAYPTQSMVVMRNNPDGTPDTTFNGTGLYAFPIGGYVDAAGGSMAFDASGNILVPGVVGINHSASPNYNDDMALWRITSAGTLDTTFNGTGYIVDANAALAIADPVDEAMAVAVDAYGRIIVAGTSRNASGFDGTGGGYKNSSVVIWRYLSSGVADTTFNSGSHFKIVDDQFFHQNQYAGRLAMKLDSFGRIVIVGHRDPDFEAGGDWSIFRMWRLWN